MNIQHIENKWQQIWQNKSVFKAEINTDKPKYYVLEMLPYPSGKIHVGHLRNYAIGDVLSRFLKSSGYNVLHPMGFDAFGLPAENAAIANKTHPAKWTYANIENMTKQLKSIGLSYDWSRAFNTCDPDYYKHEQKFFIELYNKGLAYQKESTVSWDPVDQTVLANEQVVDGKGWRSGAPIERIKLKQWFLKITDYADELLSEIDNLSGWPESVRNMQSQWIGKSEGANIKFKLAEADDFIEVYTTTPETIFGITSLALSYNHPIVTKHVEQTDKIINFIDRCKKVSTSEADIETMPVDGIKTNLFAQHPFDKNIKIPVIIANYVLQDYGTGAIMSVPAHCEKDHDLATKMNTQMIEVIKSQDEGVNIAQEAYTDDGTIINSDFLNGLNREKAKTLAIRKLEENKLGLAKTNYRLRDWGVSRQRFWGCPIPMIICKNCGNQPVPKKDLPITLPDDVTFDSGGNPLDHHPTWKNVDCPKCQKPAQRETDTFDTFFESSWYFARYCNNKTEEFLDNKETNYWMPVDQYIGGIEHAVMHLLYARFFTKLMNEAGYINCREPFKNLLTQGMVLHSTFKDENGKWLYPEEAMEMKNAGKKVITGKIEKMSKSKNNVIDLESMLKNYGADVARFFVLSDSPPEKDLEWSDSGIEGAKKFINKLWLSVEEVADINYHPNSGNNVDKLVKLAHITIKNVSSDIIHFRLNKAIARIRELFNETIKSNDKNIKRHNIEVIIRLLNPFIPHMTEEMWQKLSKNENDILVIKTWPEYIKEYLVQDTITLAVQVNGKLRNTIEVKPDADNAKIEQEALGSDIIKKHIDGKTIKKVIVVKNKIVNIVAI